MCESKHPPPFTCSFSNVRFGDLLFDGYEDPLLTAAHSQLLADLAELNNGKSIIPVPVPDMTLMAFFFHVSPFPTTYYQLQYNNTNDEVYEIETGKDDPTKVGKVKSWANNSQLPALWWDSGKSREIRGSESGGMQGANVRTDKPISLYQSYMCRFVC